MRAGWNMLPGLPFWARETIRKLLHIGVVVLALPLRWLGWKYGLLFAATAMVWNSFGMPRFFHFTFREEEVKTGYSRGMLSYPVIVFILMMLFPLPIAVSQWATLSFGDGFATLAGRFFGHRPLPWNKDKTYLGMLAFIVMGTIGASFFFWFTLPNALGSSFLWEGHHLLITIRDLSPWQIFLVCFGSTAAAAFFESLPIPYIDDNVAAPLAGAVTKLLLCYIV
jgi:dolichol kinase